LTGNEVQIAGEAAEGAITFTNWSAMANTPGNQAFVEKYRAKYPGIEPDPWAAQSYATLYILAEAIANAQSAEATAVRDALANTMDVPTILGNFSFDEVGDAVYDPIVLTVENGELVAFE
jgi:branched-chain amino acid transport system substrate-binding protein